MNLTPAKITDNSTGSASSTLAALADLSTSDTYSDAAVNASLGVIKNALATLAAKLNTVIDQVRSMSK